ncbi:ATP synthase epsilon chain [Kordia sp. SMS9]|uniref:F0F1 ATP synthase subunit epsilon n=1 Tax=Kordia sp. SMS9 TaxID=2282170 RepID=UPI000E0DC709|nr:F0F1 ATP synthase subunit epsilon [Kordia sp. SMS9]AXG68508.1 ATP synthase epsilon chain [Kordia sp. SMS9]
MYLEIVTPEAVLFKGEVTSVAVPGINGEFQMLNNHAPIVSLLGEGTVKIQGDITLDEEIAEKFTQNGKETILAINSGTIEMKDNKVIVLAD